MNARTADVPDTARRHLLTLAHRRIAFSSLSVEDEVAMASTIADRIERDTAFRALCGAIRAEDPQQIASALDVLTGGAR